jgi:transposase
MGSYSNKLFFQEAITVNVQMFYPDWTFLHFVTSATEVHLYIQSEHSGSLFPSCHRCSCRIHSHYWRTLRDTPIRSLPVFLHVRARKFFYDHPHCGQRIFTERHLEWWNAYARRTSRLATFFKHVAFSLSAEAASKLSRQYGSRLSADAFLYLIRKEQLPSLEEPSVIGIDDWR